MNNQVKLIDAEKLLESLKKELEFCVKEKFNERNTRFYLGRETALTDIIKQIETGKFTSDTPPVPTIKPGDKDTANLIADLLFAFINQDAYYPHDFEIKAFEDAITVLRPHFEHINYHPKLFVDHLERMRRSYRE